MFRLNFVMIMGVFSIFTCIQAEENFPWDDKGHHGMELEIVRSYLPVNPVILEAGAHYGEDTVTIANKWPQSMIYAFEPNPHAFNILQRATNGIPNVKIYPHGLFSATDFYTFNVNAMTDGSSSLLPDNHVPGVTWYRDVPITVYCMNLDEWAVSENIDHIDYMWLDMEGVEYYVLSSSLNILSTVKALSTEVNFREFRKGMSQFSDLRELLENNGFSLYSMWGVKDWQGTAVFIRSDLMTNIEQ